MDVYRVLRFLANTVAGVNDRVEQRELIEALSERGSVSAVFEVEVDEGGLRILASVHAFKNRCLGAMLDEDFIIICPLQTSIHVRNVHIEMPTLENMADILLRLVEVARGTPYEGSIVESVLAIGEVLEGLGVERFVVDAGTVLVKHGSIAAIIDEHVQEVAGSVEELARRIGGGGARKN